MIARVVLGEFRKAIKTLFISCNNNNKKKKLFRFSEFGSMYYKTKQLC